jgi:hypothetical protein
LHLGLLRRDGRELCADVVEDLVHLEALGGRLERVEVDVLVPRSAGGRACVCATRKTLSVT